jgi:hypothetical protein
MSEPKFFGRDRSKSDARATKREKIMEPKLSEEQEEKYQEAARVEKLNEEMEFFLDLVSQSLMGHAASYFPVQTSRMRARTPDARILQGPDGKPWAEVNIRVQFPLNEGGEVLNPSEFACLLQAEWDKEGSVSCLGGGVVKKEMDHA